MRLAVQAGVHPARVEARRAHHDRWEASKSRQATRHPLLRRQLLTSGFEERRGVGREGWSMGGGVAAVARPDHGRHPVAIDWQ